jgi:membrane protein
VVLASSADAKEVEHYVTLLGIKDALDAITTIDDAESSKPAGDIFAAALAKVAPLGADQAAGVGDTPWDAKAASKIGLRTVGFRSGGFPDEALAEAGACELYDGPSDLLARFDRSVFGRG